MSEKNPETISWWQKGLKWLGHFHYRIERALFYRDPKKYWTERGGERYFEEQEKYQSRTEKSEFVTDEIARLPVASILEVGCGYGKQLRNLRKKTMAKLTGVDFSPTQLKKAEELGLGDILVYEADAQKLPFADQEFDLVFSSAVVLHHPPPNAARILSEMIRVAKSYVVHNEDTNISSTRYGYDLSRVYEGLGLEIVKCCKISSAANPERTQFLIVRLPHGSLRSFTADAIRPFLRSCTTVPC